MKNEEFFSKDNLDQPLNMLEDEQVNVKGRVLNYQPHPAIQGQCLLTTIIPIKKVGWKYVLFVFFSIIFIGIPYLLTFWYPKLKKKWYYQEVSIQQATQFYVLNSDGESTYPQKQQGQHYFTESKTKNVIFFLNRYLKYIISDANTVKAANFDFLPRLKQIQKQGTKGLTLQQARNIRKSYGIGAMILEQKDIVDLFLSQVMRPLYLFVFFSCLLWTYQNYFYYSIMIFVTAAFGIGASLIQTYRINKKIFQMAFYETEVNLLRDGQIKRGKSRYVAPGDIVFIKQSMKMPFDGLLLHGSALSNQCSITGQSVPILKKAEPIKSIGDIKSSYIYQGSLIIQVNSKQKFKQNLSVFQQFRQQYGLPVYVTRTNFITMKGQLIRIISFPVDRQNIFQKQSTKFLFFLFGLAVISYVVLLFKLSQIASVEDMIVKFLDLITVTVPPGLPVSMTFGIVFALQKMKKKSIFCTSPNKTVVGGMTNFLCFDKTGTLTQDFMDFNAYLPSSVAQSNAQFTQVIKKQNKKQMESMIKKNMNVLYALNNMAVNHTIVKLESTGQNVGDPMQVKMFQFGQFQLYNDPNHDQQILESFKNSKGHEGNIYRRFQFDSELFRMSTISKSNVTGGDFFIYSKGSPQHMLNIFHKDTVPQDYNKVLKKYTCMGFRVLAIGHRRLKADQATAQRLQLQSNLVFDGFQIFQNTLKIETKAALSDLRQANLPFVMITGDNPLTASSIAYQSGIFDSKKKAFICHYQKDQYILQKFHQHQLQSYEQDDVIKFNLIPELLQFTKQKDIQLCLTGKAFNHLFDHHYETYEQESKQLLSYTKVYARAKPNDKVRVITAYQSFGKIVGMCGDGANDCGALKQADIGLSLSQAQASISAPFTSQITNISSMIELLKQCRAGLATNFSLFNIMAIYSLVQYNSVVIIQYYFGFPGDFQYFYWDACCNFAFFLTFGYTGTAKKLTKQLPNKSLFTVSNISQLLIVFVIQMVGQLIMVQSLYWFSTEIEYTQGITREEFEQNGGSFVTDSFQGNVLFFYGNFIYILTLLAYSISRPWRKQFYTNIPFTVILVLVLALSSVLVVVPESRPQFLQIYRIEDPAMLSFILLFSWGVGILIYILQKLILEPIFNKIKLKYPDSLYI